MIEAEAHQGKVKELNHKLSTSALDELLCHALDNLPEPFHEVLVLKV